MPISFNERGLAHEISVEMPPSFASPRCLVSLPQAEDVKGAMDSKHNEKQRPSSTGTMRLFRTRLKWPLALCSLILLWSTLYLSMFPAHFDDLLIPGHKAKDELLSWSQLDSLNVPERDNHTATTRRLRVFMAADQPGINLCKTIMSAIALGYPMPTLLNWKQEYNRPHWHFGGSHIAKLESLLDVVDVLSESGREEEVREDDLVLLVDAYDVWFQLPPSVLISRFHQLNAEANTRIRQHWTNLNIPSTFPIKPPRQEIVMTTAKDCFPDHTSGSNPHYPHWPASPMADDLYGRETDKVLWSVDAARRYKNVRPRCVNSGMIMGTMGSLRHALRRSKEKVDAVSKLGRQLWSDQALIGEVMGEQELWREWVQSLGASWDGDNDNTQNNRSTLPRDVRRVADAALLGRRFEFGIGLDYNFTTIPPTCSAETDGAFARIDDKGTLQHASAKAGVLGPVRIADVPADLTAYRDPDNLLTATPWGKVPLYTDFFFGAVPVGIHHNAYSHGLKPQRLREWWTQLWYHSQLRDLVTRRLINPQSEQPLATLEGGIEYRAPVEDEESKTVRTFSPLRVKGDEFAPIGWNEVCQKPKTRAKWYDELFGDGIGPPAFEKTPI